MYKSNVKTIEFVNNRVFFLNQTLLPLAVIIEEQCSITQVWDSIKMLKVRGAPLLGVAGAYGLLVGVRDFQDIEIQAFKEKISEVVDYLNSSRPTAVNLAWALARMKNIALQYDGKYSIELYNKLVKEAIAIHEEDINLCDMIGHHGSLLIKDGMGILTHCNAGALATSGIGTALAPMYAAHSKGINFKVYADETRPLLQGSRLTAWELQQSGIDTALICDNMVAYVMNKGLIDIVIVGTDRVARNGDTANKIGTYGVGILAKHFNIPLYIACPSSTFDINTPTGDDIIIEERDSREITSFGDKQTAPDGIDILNPAFDVTPHDLITGFITEKGIVTAPFEQNLQKILIG